MGRDRRFCLGKEKALLGMSAGPRIPRVRSSTYGSEPFDGKMVTKGLLLGSSIRARTDGKNTGGVTRS